MQPTSNEFKKIKLKVDTLWDFDMVAQVSPLFVVYGMLHFTTGAPVGVGAVLFSANDVGVEYAYPVFPQLEVEEANSLAKSSEYPTGEPKES